MILFGVIVFLYLFIGWVVSYESHKRDWNSRLAHWDQASHLGWWLLWFWYGGMIFHRVWGGWTGRFVGWTQDTLETLFDRMVNFQWRRDDEADS